MLASCNATVHEAQKQQLKLPQTPILFWPSNILAIAIKSWKGLSFEEQMTLLIKILLGGLFEKLDLTEFGTEKSDCRFGTFRLVGGGVISAKFETITIKGNLLRYCRK
jgi:hypothetical protein